MKITSRILVTFSAAALLATVGCATTRQVRTARSLEVVDTVSTNSVKGYVEFTSLSKDAVVPIYLVDDVRAPHMLAATGLRKGDRYSYSRHRTLTAEMVRVAVPPGRHTFMIERDGQFAQVPVEAGKVTRVEIDYVPLYRGDSIVTYRVGYEMFEPMPFAEKAVGEKTRKG